MPDKRVPSSGCAAVYRSISFCLFPAPKVTYACVWIGVARELSPVKDAIMFVFMPMLMFAAMGCAPGARPKALYIGRGRDAEGT